MMPLSGDLNERQNEALSRIEDGIEHITEMTNRLSHLSRLQFGEDAELEMTFVDVEELIEEELQRHNRPAEQKEIQLVTEAAPELPLVLCDGLLYGQAVTNLVQNALKFTPEKGTITVRAYPGDENTVVIAVADTGMGIREEDRVHLFEAFYRVPQREGDPPRPRGSGLGLALVRAIADAHNGRVWVESTFGEGSTFYLEMPVRPRKD